MDDRTVHASYNGMEIVRYNRAGKWYFEPVGYSMLKRQHVTVSEAASQAVWATEHGNGQVFLGLPGGMTFDSIYRKLRAMDVLGSDFRKKRYSRR